MLPSTPPYSSIRDEIYPPSTHRRQPASLPHPMPLAALFFQNRSTRGNKQESLHYAHPTLQPFLTNLMPPAFPTCFPPPSFPVSFSLSLCFSLFREKLPRCINEGAHLPAGFMEKHTSLGGRCSLRVKEAAAAARRARGWVESETIGVTAFSPRSARINLHSPLTFARCRRNSIGGAHVSMNGNAAKTFKSSRYSRRIARYYCAPAWQEMIALLAGNRVTRGMARDADIINN